MSKNLRRLPRAHLQLRRLPLQVGVALGLISTTFLASAQASRPEPYVAGRILVMPRAGMPDHALQKVLREHGASASRRAGSNGLRIVDLPRGQEEAVAQRLAKNPHFEFAEVDRYLPVAMTPNDPYFGSEWHLQKIGAPSGWESSHGRGVTIAILDTGVDGTHPDLSAQMVPGWNFYNNSSDTTDVYGHGTSTAGAAAAATNNGVGVAGVAGQARIMPIRVTDGSGYATASAIAQGITYAADKGARVASISIDGVAASSATINAANYMKSKGGLVVVAAGNNSRDEGIAQTTSMIPVSATDSADALTSWSSYGRFVAMSAPGLNIYAPNRGGGYWSCWGTSFSTPITAGTVALIMAANPQLGSGDVEKILYSTAVDLGAPGRDGQYGYGRVDAGAAVRAAVGAMPVTDTQAPTVSIAAPVGGATVSGLLNVDVAAADNVGISKVELRVNGSLLATDMSAPYAFTWDSSAATNGTVTLTAVAYDSAGNPASTSVAVNVSNVAVPPTPDATPPTVTILSPTNGSALRAKGSVTISAAAADNSGTVSQKLYVDDRLVASTTSGSLSYSWNVNKVSRGTHTIKVVATDAAQNASTASVQVVK